MSKLDELGGLKVAHEIFDEDCHLDGPTIEERFGRALIERIEELERREADSLFAGNPIEPKVKLQRYRVPDGTKLVKRKRPEFGPLRPEGK